MSENNFFDRIRSLIATGRLQDALQELPADHSDQTIRNTIIALSARLNTVRQMVAEGTMPHSEYLQELNRLSSSTLELADRLESEAPVRNVTLDETYQRSLARIKVLEVLREDSDGLTIREIHDRSGLTSRRFLIFALDELIHEDMVERFRVENMARNKLSPKGRKFAQRLR